MVQVVMEMPEGVFASLRKDPLTFGRELRVAAAVKWYELRMVSQGRAAEIAGLSRAEFLEALGRFRVSPYQVDTEGTKLLSTHAEYDRVDAATV